MLNKNIKILLIFNFKSSPLTNVNLFHIIFEFPHVLFLCFFIKNIITFNNIYTAILFNKHN